jgi:hypothetical protein
MPVAYAQNIEAMDRAIRGVDLTSDPVDGKQREVWTGSGAPHWINALGQIADSVTQPGPSYRKLNTLR